MLKVHQGKPDAIIESVAREITEALEAAGIMPTGVHILALIQIVGAAWHDANKANHPLNQPPSFKTMLTFFVKLAMDSSWTDEETKDFYEDVVRVVQGCGGQKVDPNSPPPFLLPPSGMVH